MNETIKALSELYRPYTEVIKPLLALIEAEREEFPLPLYNEVRELNDHVARTPFLFIQRKKIKFSS